MAGIDGSIVNVALPTLVRDLQTNFSTVQWVVLAYVLAITTLILGIGRLADIRGKKTLFSVGFIIFTIGSLLCGWAPSITWLIGFRALQGLGAAFTMALAMAIVTEAFPSDERGKAVGITGATVSFGYIAGPTLGGFLIDWLSWRWVFFINLPIGVLGTWLALRYVPESQPTDKKSFDYWGNLTLFISLFSLLMALTFGPEWGFHNSSIWWMFSISLMFLTLFIGIELKVKHPMISLRLFQNPLLTTNLLTVFLSFVALAGCVILLPFYLENIIGCEISQVGLLLIIIPVALGLSHRRDFVRSVWSPSHDHDWAVPSVDRLLCDQHPHNRNQSLAIYPLLSTHWAGNGNFYFSQ